MMHANESINVKGVQRLNRLRVVNLIRKNENTVRSDISGHFGLSPAAISGIVSYLIRLGLVVESGVENVERTGRKGALLHFCSERFTIVTIGCDDDELLRVCLTDLSGAVVACREYRIAALPAAQITSLLCGGVAELLRLPAASRVIGVGMSVSGMVLDHGENVLSSVVDWDIPAIRAKLKKLCDVPFLVSNSTFTKALWLCRGSVEEVAGLTVFVDLTKGVGASLLQDGVRLGAVAGEIGQTVVCAGDPADGAKRGWLEAVCSPARLLRLCRERGGDAADLKTFSALLAQGSEAAQSALGECAGYLGCGLANLVALFDPNKMLINAADYVDCPQVVECALQVMRERLYRGLGQGMRVETLCFEESDFVRAIAHELCDKLFSEELPIDIFRLMADIALTEETN